MKLLNSKLIPTITFYLICVSISPAYAKTWPDLESEQEVKIYGSERSAKFKASNIFYDMEDWKDHYSVRALGIYRYYDYPLAKSKTIFPFYYHIQSKIDNREYKRIINVNVTKENDSVQKSFFPFVFWGNRPNTSYLVTIPFFFQNKTETGNSVGFPILPLVYYNHKEKISDSTYQYTRFLTLFHFERNEKSGLTDLSFTPLFYYSKENYLFLPLLLFYQNFRETARNYWFGPIYYYRDRSMEKRLFVFFPFVVSFVSPKREVDFVFPLYLNIKDSEEDYHINLLWYTKVHNANVNLATNDGNVYLDYDFGLFYNLVGISKRSRILTGNSLKTQELNQSTKPELKKKREFNRENSDQFTGYQLLFGIFSYEKADTKKHIRLLPFAWFTWDESSEDKVVLVPPFFPIWLSYVSADLEYKIIFPLYGKQKDKTSEIQSYLINGYIKEEYEENHRVERSYFWPFVNVYESDIDSGHRVLPFYVYNQTKKEKSFQKNAYTFISIYKRVSNPNFERKEFLVWPIWISYDWYLFKDQNPITTIWFTPFFYRRVSDSSSRTNLFWFIDWEFESYKSTFTKNQNETNQTATKETLSHLFLFPFYYSDSSFSILPISFNFWSKEEFTTFTMLNYYHSKKEGHYYNFLYLVESENSTNHYQFRSLWDFLFSFQKKPKEIERLTLLWLGYDNTSDKKTINFFPLVRTTVSEEETSKLYGPFIYYESKSADEITELALAGIGYYHNQTKSDNQYSTYVLLGAIYQEKTELERGFVKRGSLWGWLWEYQTEDNGYEKFSILKLFSYSKETDGTKKILGISI
ncbi:LA_1737 family protein [Leptospira jelokensis]|uniref:Uncharacterized protein n=1 Tax=Leptospira jelokensis TaxID=2484931 RepID=A0A4Z0ZXS7_9LEPT|nr:hypothetical protein [Leptospira jelokensis]TGL64945.1 hypothetical protein EHQ62_10100 [Leptospira jelokensis]